MEGHIIEQRSSYRRGLVLGLTMAEIMVLLVFCLLIAMAAFLKREEDKRVTAEQQLKEEKLQNEQIREVVNSLSKSAAVAEKIEGLSGLSDPQAIDQYWRELVASRGVVKEIEKSVTVSELREGLANIAAMRASHVDVDKAIHDAEIVDAINRAMTKPGDPPVSAQVVLDTLARGMTQGSGGHQWPPIIRMSEADGYFFKSGSAELSPSFQDALLFKTPNEILNYIRKYDVDIIEVVGHTDERPIGARGQVSNLDRDLLPVLKSQAGVASLVPADNAGLGLARAVAVVSVLRQSPLLAPYKLIPLSGAQLVNTDETLAISGFPGDIQQRRRIEIRLRKSSSGELTTGAVTVGPAAGPR
jgi:flagellar motor protein MotB